MGLRNVKLSIATTDYDHFRDFRTGVVKAEGIDHSWSLLGHHENLRAHDPHREWDVSELSFAKFPRRSAARTATSLGFP